MTERWTMFGNYDDNYAEGYNAAIAAYNSGDYGGAAGFMIKAAKNGDEYAQMVLGKMYYMGKGVKRSAERAVKWWRTAAGNGNRRAADLLKWAENYGYPEDPDLLLTDRFRDGDFEYTVTGMDRRVSVSGYFGESAKPVLKYKVQHGDVTYFLAGIDDYAFEGSEIEGMVLPEGLSYIGEGSFEDVSTLKRISLPSSVTEIGVAAFSGCASLSKIDFGTGVETIGDYAFEGCSALTSVTVPESVRALGTGTFIFCDSLRRASILGRIKSLPEFSFSHCASLRAVDLPDSMRRISYGAFEYCSSLTSIELPGGIDKIEGGAFAGCRSLKSVVFGEGCERYRTENGVLYDSVGKKTVQGLCGSMSKHAYVAPGTESIGRGAFAYCEKLEGVSLPDGLRKIGYMAFSSCEKLSEVNLPDGLEEIGGYAFSECTSLRELSIPNSVKKMGDCSLYGTSVGDVRLPKGKSRKRVFGPSL